ncbi:hypothetical protein [Acidianus sp. HS-5]|uniref:hypothetical protein n=1 Tax=Acidianus sp. HS-5 TaxID=2886040 RepID=UPI001F2E2886|nr:hypothetical protein [Acidianus sp. HS-5]
MLGFDETFLRMGEKEAEGAGDKLFSEKAKVRSADLLSPVRSNVVTQFALRGDQKPSEFLQEFVNKAVQHINLSYVIADAGFLNLEILKRLCKSRDQREEQPERSQGTLCPAPYREVLRG